MSPIGSSFYRPPVSTTRFTSVTQALKGPLKIDAGGTAPSGGVRSSLAAADFDGDWCGTGKKPPIPPRPLFASLQALFSKIANMFGR